MKCRFCGSPLSEKFADLFNAPPSNSFLVEEQLLEPETYFPLTVFFCTECWLVQIDEYKKSADIFNGEYAYFSSFSSSWLKHAEKYVGMITDRLKLDENSFVVEIGSNDGYLLKNFVSRKIPCLGIEPSANTAEEARKFGVESHTEFFGKACAEKLVQNRGCADLIVGNNVLAHVPDINDFVEGLSILVSKTGTVTMEFPHLLNLIKYNQFDTIYHEHFSYLSLASVERIFASHGLKIYDVEELPTHGGSLRVYAASAVNTALQVQPSVNQLKDQEIAFGLTSADIYRSFQRSMEKVKNDFLQFLLEQKSKGKRVAAYGAAAKGNTLLNYCGLKQDLIDFVVDASPFKQNKYLPGSHIPVVNEQVLRDSNPDFVVIFPWNIKDEITQQLSYLSAQFVTAIPELTVS